MLLSDFLTQSAQKFPDKIAIVSHKERIAYKTVLEQSIKLANGFTYEGILRQDRIAVYLENSIESIISIFGILKAGGIFVIINPQVKSKKLSYIVNDCQIKVIVTDSAGLNQVNEIIPYCPSLELILHTNYSTESKQLPDLNTTQCTVHSFEQFISQNSPIEPPQKCISIDLASLMYTSGSTGDPKGVMLTHLNMVTAATSITQYLENTPEDIILSYLPLSFDYGLYQALMSIKMGATLILEKAFVYPYQAIQKILEENVTGFPIVPAMIALLLQLKDIDKNNFDTIRYITNTGQALPPIHIKQMRTIFSKARIYSMYGLTECKRVAYLPYDQIDKRPLSVGIAIPNTEVWLQDENGNKITTPGEIGELVIRGAHVMKGYWNKPEETAAVLKDGIYPHEKILMSRDYFKIDEEGYLYFVSRIDDVIKSGGERISPKEIEDVLYEMEGISEAAVIGVADTILGNAIKAFVVFKDDYKKTIEEIFKFCSIRLERSRIPKYIEIRGSLPKSNNGKIRKKDLEEEANSIVD